MLKDDEYSRKELETIIFKAEFQQHSRFSLREEVMEAEVVIAWAKKSLAKLSIPNIQEPIR